MQIKVMQQLYGVKYNPDRDQFPQFKRAHTCNNYGIMYCSECVDKIL